LSQKKKNVPQQKRGREEGGGLRKKSEGAILPSSKTKAIKKKKRIPCDEGPERRPPSPRENGAVPHGERLVRQEALFGSRGGGES